MGCAASNFAGHRGTFAAATRFRAVIPESPPMSLTMLLLTIFLPPVAVALTQGIGWQFLLNGVLTIIGWLPGVIHAFWVNTREGTAI